MARGKPFFGKSEEPKEEQENVIEAESAKAPEADEQEKPKEEKPSAMSNHPKFAKFKKGVK